MTLWILTGLFCVAVFLHGLYLTRKLKHDKK